MSVISKDLSRQIALKLTEKSRIAAEKAHKEYQEVATELYEAQTPQEVKDTFKKHKEWFYTRQTIYFTGHGFDYTRCNTIRNVICNDGSTDCNLRLNAKAAETLSKAKKKYDKAQKEYESLKEETRIALLALKTYNNIRKELPMAAPMLPPPMSNALVVNLNPLIKRLESQSQSQKKAEV